MIKVKNKRLQQLYLLARTLKNTIFCNKRGVSDNFHLMCKQIVFILLAHFVTRTIKQLIDPGHEVLKRKARGLMVALVANLFLYFITKTDIVIVLDVFTVCLGFDCTNNTICLLCEIFVMCIFVVRKLAKIRVSNCVVCNQL